jgi:uncharacterized protein
LMITGLVQAFQSTENSDYLNFAIRQADFILDNMISGEAELYRIYKKGEKKIPAFLDDYAFFIQSLIVLYTATFEERWLLKAKALTDYVLAHFYDRKDKLFFYTSDNSHDLPVRKKEVQDSVMPSSNSVMAENLYRLSVYFDSTEYHEVFEEMCGKLKENMKRFPRYFTNWINLVIFMEQKQTDIAITGENPLIQLKKLTPFLKPHYIVAGGSADSKIPLLADRHSKGKTRIYICVDKVCSLPVDTAEEAIELLSSPTEKNIKYL